ncbi:archaea-specific SMC-related protein [Haloparvum sedimenti]|uniref:archaea-specific SMC-related protein n=1 Tax=Haloparvum sedimenti TaxID=1678448 RepID=UPI00071E79EC|nr:archaea-specific SMC-related protein [Haloparvum sedimenti]
MTPIITTEASAPLEVQNLGGIENTSVTLSPGVNVLEGRNATNRTSLLRSIMAAMGSDRAQLKGDADEGRVELRLGDETYTRTFTRENGTVNTDGDPYLDDATLADLFAFLLEDNEARQAIAQAHDLRDIIMRPVDTEAIENEIREAEAEKDRIDDELAALEKRANRLPDLEEKRESLKTELAEKESELEEVREELESLDGDVDESRAQRDKFEKTLAELNDARTELDQVQRKLDSQTEQRNALKQEREDLREERENLSTSVREISNLGQRIGELRERKRTLNSLIDRLQNVIQFNRDIMEDADSELREALVTDSNHITDELMEENQKLRCWTCGSDIERSDITETLENLEALREDKMAERKEVVSDLEDLRGEKQTLEEHQQRREQIEHRLEQISDRLDQQERVIADLRENREETTNEIQELEANLEELNAEEDRILELNKHANELEVDIQDLRSDLNDVNTEIEDLESDLSERSSLEERREEVNNRLETLRTRITDIEQNAVSEFNEHMDTVLDLLDYNNLERIWIERRDSSPNTSDSQAVFDLHIVRSTDEGVAYEDTIDHLSESEREVTGLVFALAGYLVHEVYEVVPYMLLDSLEAIDAERIASIVDYFKEYVPYLVVALLPEDAQALGDYSYIQNI